MDCNINLNDLHMQANYQMQQTEATNVQQDSTGKTEMNIDYQEARTVRQTLENQKQEAMTLRETLVKEVDRLRQNVANAKEEIEQLTGPTAGGLFLDPKEKRLQDKIVSLNQQIHANTVSKAELDNLVSDIERQIQDDIALEQMVQISDDDFDQMISDFY